MALSPQSYVHPTLLNINQLVDLAGLLFFSKNAGAAHFYAQQAIYQTSVAQDNECDQASLNMYKEMAAFFAKQSMGIMKFEVITLFRSNEWPCTGEQAITLLSEYLLSYLDYKGLANRFGFSAVNNHRSVDW